MTNNGVFFWLLALCVSPSLKLDRDADNRDVNIEIMRNISLFLVYLIDVLLLQITISLLKSILYHQV